VIEERYRDIDGGYRMDTFHDPFYYARMMAKVFPDLRHPAEEAEDLAVWPCSGWDGTVAERDLYDPPEDVRET
jgi:hypothetical protein